jgi:MFS family permease
MMGKWVPPLERSRLVSFAYSGTQIGVVVSQPVSGLLCQYGFAGGWPSVFYVFGKCDKTVFILNRTEDRNRWVFGMFNKDLIGISENVRKLNF